MFIGGLILDMSSKCNVPELRDVLGSVCTDLEFLVVGDLEGRCLNTFETIRAGVYFVASTDQGKSIEIPSRNSVATAWVNGTILNTLEIDDLTSLDTPKGAGYEASKLLVKFNSNRHDSNDGDSNYANKAYKRIHSKMKGVWAMTLIYMSLRPSIILSRKDRMMYLSLVYTGSALMLLWSDCIIDVKNDSAFMYNIAPLAESELLVIHPSYILSKVRKWGSLYNYNFLKVCSIIDRYLTRSAR